MCAYLERVADPSRGKGYRNMFRYICQFQAYTHKITYLARKMSMSSMYTVNHRLLESLSKPKFNYISDSLQWGSPNSLENMICKYKKQNIYNTRWSTNHGQVAETEGGRNPWTPPLPMIIPSYRQNNIPGREIPNKCRYRNDTSLLSLFLLFRTLKCYI